MREGPDIAEAAALMGDPARAAMLCALLDGRALTAGELAAVASVTPQTASAHLARLTQGGLLTVEKQGRHRYLRLAGPEVADALDALSALAGAKTDTRPKRLPGPRESAMRWCRSCYDHLAGAAAVALADGMCAKGWLEAGEADFGVTEAGWRGLEALGVDRGGVVVSRRRLASRCLDWSERRPHVGGALGAALMRRAEAAGWIVRAPGSRVVRLRDQGLRALGAVADLALRAPPH